MKFWPFKKKPVKLCKDCKWCIYMNSCENPKVNNASLIDGRYFIMNIEVARIVKCGERAKYFEPKEGL